MRAKQLSLCGLSCVAALFVGQPASLRAQSMAPASPPVAPARPVTDDYYGTKIVDPYRYMENLKDAEVQSWLKAQNNYTRAVLAKLPGRQQLLARIRELGQGASAEVFDVQRLPSDFYIYQKILLAKENVPKLYLRRGKGGRFGDFASQGILARPSAVLIEDHATESR